MNTLIYVYGALVAVVVPHLFVRPIQDHIWRRVLRHNSIPLDQLHRDMRNLAVVVGGVERTLYFVSILAGEAAFIGVWLALKAAGQWRGWSDGREFDWTVTGAKATGKVPGAQVFNAHLIGVGLSLLFAATGAYSVRWLQNDRTLLAAAAGAVVVVASWILLLWAKHPFRTRGESAPRAA